ncbi:hypothetical protein [Lignipirellula cremea]|uniref:hypothetical protein n=1 Tax=Lignipirellula cremea TaxID=2528010 RepID=UPI0011A8222D|nr:hypothetical protein [Lignipirellula cremea]
MTACCVVITRGLINGASPEATIPPALIVLFLFAGIGWIVGRIAASAVDESVRTQANAELEAYQQQQGDD